MHRLGTTLTLVIAAGAAGAAMLAASGSAGTAAKQQIAIEERAVSREGELRGTFKLIPMTRGAVKADSGTYTFVVNSTPTVIVNGQRVTRYTSTATLKGKRGTLTIRTATRSTNSGGGYLIGAGPWFIKAGTKSYAGLRGGGAGSAVLTPRGVVFGRYEGYVGNP
jgi:hypothetical protein